MKITTFLLMVMTAFILSCASGSGEEHGHSHDDGHTHEDGHSHDHDDHSHDHDADHQQETFTVGADSTVMDSIHHDSTHHTHEDGTTHHNH